MSQLVPFVDWLSISFEFESEYKLNSFIEYLECRLMLTFDFGSAKQSDNFSGKWVRYNSAEGCSIALNYCNSIERIQVRLLLSGDFLSKQVRYYIHRVSGELRTKWGGRCTRIDIAVDDPLKQIDYDCVIQAIRDKNVAGCNQGKLIESIGGEHPGRTVYCGSRRSAKYGRFYNKGEFDRFEVEFKLDMADSIFVDYISASSEDSGKILAGVLKSAFSFLDKISKNLDRNKVFSWWQEFLDRIEGTPIEIARKKPVTSIERTLSWIHRSVSKAVLKCRTALGVEEFDKLLAMWAEESRQRITPMDNLHICQFLATV